MQAIDSARGANRQEPGEEAIISELTAKLEAVLSRNDATWALLRQVASSLLREMQAARLITEQFTAAEADNFAIFAKELAELGRRFDEFDFLHEAMQDVIGQIEISLSEHRADHLSTSEQLRVQN